MPGTKPKADRFHLTKASHRGPESPPSDRTYLYDTKQPGLAICVTRAGTKTFYVYQRKLNGRPERMRLGVWPNMKI